MSERHEVKRRRGRRRRRGRTVVDLFTTKYVLDTKISNVVNEVLRLRCLYIEKDL